MADITVRPLNGLVGALATVGGYATASGGGDRFSVAESGLYILHVVNGHTSPQSVIIDDANSVTPDAATTFNPDATLAVVNATSRIFNLGYAPRFKDANGWVNLTYSGVTALTLMVYRVN